MIFSLLILFNFNCFCQTHESTLRTQQILKKAIDEDTYFAVDLHCTYMLIKEDSMGHWTDELAIDDPDDSLHWIECNYVFRFTPSEVVCFLMYVDDPLNDEGFINYSESLYHQASILFPGDVIMQGDELLGKTSPVHRFSSWGLTQDIGTSEQETTFIAGFEKGSDGKVMYSFNPFEKRIWFWIDAYNSEGSVRYFKRYVVKDYFIHTF